MLWESFTLYRGGRGCRAFGVVLGFGLKGSTLPHNLSSHPFVSMLMSMEVPVLVNILSYLGERLPDKIFALMKVGGDEGCARFGAQEVVFSEQCYATAEEAAAAAGSFYEAGTGDEDEDEPIRYEIDKRENPRDGPLLSRDKFFYACLLVELSLESVKAAASSNPRAIEHVYCITDVCTDPGRPHRPEASWDSDAFLDLDSAAQRARVRWGGMEEDGDGSDSDFGDYTSNPKQQWGAAAKYALLMHSYSRGIRVHRLTVPGYEPAKPVIPRSNGLFAHAICSVQKQIRPHMALEAKANDLVENLTTATLRDIVSAACSAVAAKCDDSKVLDAGAIRDATESTVKGGLGKHALMEGSKAVQKFVASAAAPNASAPNASAPNASVSSASTSSEPCISASGLLFPILEVEGLIKAQADTGISCSRQAAVYAAAVLEYMSAELLELGGQCALDHSARRILSKHVAEALLDDSELSEHYRKVAHFWGGKL